MTHSVTVTTAQKLSTAQEKTALEVAQKLLHTKAADIELTNVVDPTVLGGLKITAGSTEIDATTLSKLEKIKQHLRSKA